MTESKRYLWLGLEAGLWPSYLLEHRLANALVDAGREVTMIRCGGVLKSQCPVMTANRIPVTASMGVRAQVCGDCRHNAALAQQDSRYSTGVLDSYVSAELVAEVNTILSGVTRSNWSELEVDGIPVGRYATYLTMLHHKLPDVTASDEAWSEYLADLHNALLMLKALPALFAETRPTHVVVYNPLYPTHRMFVEYASARGVGLVSVSASSYLPARYDAAYVFPRIESSQTMVDSISIAESLTQACSSIEVTAVANHLTELIRGSDPWVYSSEPSGLNARGIRERLGIRSNSAVVTVLVSSPDETRSSLLVGAEYIRDSENGFSDIPEFIRQVIESAQRLPEIDFVIRLHPRLLPNKRETVSSPDLIEIQGYLDCLPSNAVINSPEQGLSLYDMIRISRGAVNQSSSAGLEFLALGLPVIQYDPARQNAYPPSFGPSVKRHDTSALAEAIKFATSSGWSIENSRNAFRWYATILLRATLHLAELQTSAQAELVRDLDASSDRPTHGPSLRRLVPIRVRERIARRLARQGRKRDLAGDRSSTSWEPEWILRVDGLDRETVVWEPLIVARGYGDVQSESELLHATVSEFIARITAGDEEGLGALGQRES